MISLGNVTFQYAGCEEGVRNIDLTIRDGECVVLTGPSGGGKTTLTRLINGLASRLLSGEADREASGLMKQSSPQCQAGA